MIVPVILSGGSGTRLWPLSTPERPKQFLPLTSARTLFQETLLRLEGLADLAEPIVVCNEAHRFLVAEQLREIGRPAAAIVLEPAGRNTAPAIAAAALIAEEQRKAEPEGKPEPRASVEPSPDPDCILLVLPADHVIADGARFRDAVQKAVRAARAGKLVTFGIVPTHAETGYGYIEQADGGGEGQRGSEDQGGSEGQSAGDWTPVARFVEKPDRPTAERYVASGRFFWNSGMFVFSTSVILSELERWAPAIAAAAEPAVAAAAADADFKRLGDAFLTSPSESVDNAVMEKTERAAVVRLDAGWSDVGSWAALHAAAAKDPDGNVLRGQVVAESCRDSYIHAGARSIAAIGLDEIVVVETESSVLIMRKDRSQRVKDVGAKLDEAQRADGRERGPGSSRGLS